MWLDDEVKGKILHKLTRAGKFEHSHTAVENLQKGFPKDMIGEVKDMVNNLKKEGILIVKPTSYGEQVSINLDLKEKVLEYIKLFLDKKD
ncbi:hypothetical protein HY498_03860 [Candidatus Woesearchaeota archaeon]|nr:hypothetical protein [Candidatus Woesearchaeota archaeon]